MRLSCEAGTVGHEVTRRMIDAANRQESFDAILRRIQGEFLEMPGLRLTLVQAQRLWNLDLLVCEALLDALVDARFLMRVRGDAFVQALPSTRPLSPAGRRPVRPDATRP